MLGTNVQTLGQIAALRTKRLAAGPGAQVFPLNIIAGIAVGIVVVDTRLDRVPRGTSSHDRLLLTSLMFGNIEGAMERGANPAPWHRLTRRLAT